MRKRKKPGGLVVGWLLLTALLLTPLLLYGKQTGLAAEDFFTRTALAAGAVMERQYTGPQWLGKLFSGAYGRQEEYVDLTVEAMEIPPEALGEVVKDDTGHRSKVLIYHTHTDEAYEQVVPAYAETEQWRTYDNNHNIVRVGTVLAENLKDKGFRIIHDATNHAIPKLSTAYSRSLTTMQNYVSEEIDYYIDVHRDAYFESVDGAYTIDVGGVKTAKLALVVGKAEGDLYAQKPDFERTYALAKAVEEELNRLVPGICKPVIVRTERFNQHISPGCMLVEVGHNKNTLAEAENAAEILAQALDRVLG